MTQPAITVERLSKAYHIGLKDEIPDTFMGAMSSWARSPLRNWQKLKKLNTFRLDPSEADGRETDDGIFWALRDVNFDVAEGEVVGIIGRNGAGKSTLLKIVSRITEPTQGRITIRGRVSSLLEVGTGFHPELTGRENVYMNGTILGMTKREIDRKFDEIVEFSGVERFLDTPIKRYSSGMKVRLAFAVAAFLEPEILIIDEVLAVGDAEFQKKCLGKMKDVAEGGRTVLFVSHNMAAVRSLCSRAVLLQHGELTADGPVEDVVSAYLSAMTGESTQVFKSDQSRRGTGDVRLTFGRVLNAEGEEVDSVRAGQSVTLEFGYDNHSRADVIEMNATIYNQLGVAITNLHANLTNGQLRSPGAQGVARCRLPRLPLLPGSYRVAAAVNANGSTADLVSSAIRLEVVDSDFFPTGKVPKSQYSVCMLDHSWDAEASVPGVLVSEGDGEGA